MLTVPFPGRNGQVYEAWEGGDGPGWTLRRTQSRHREGNSRTCELLNILVRSGRKQHSSHKAYAAPNCSVTL